MSKPALAERAVTMRWRGKQWDALTDDDARARTSKARCAPARRRSRSGSELNALVDAPRPAHAPRALDRGRHAVDPQADLARHPRAGRAARALEPARALRRVRQRQRAPTSAGLKAQDQQTRYGKFRGLTLARVYIDQAEEMPRDIYHELKARLSQKGYPHADRRSRRRPSKKRTGSRKEFPADNTHPAPALHSAERL